VFSCCFQAKEGATTVQLLAARKGKGIVAGSKVRVVCIMVVIAVSTE
jgi:ribosomal protein S5